MAADRVDFAIRPIRIADADAIQIMVAEFGAYLTALGDSWQHRFTAERYREDGFGPNPAFAGFIAEAQGAAKDAALGYILIAPYYDVDLAMRMEMIVDLWVRPQARRGGVGRRLMAKAGEYARDRGARALIWNVYKPNRPAYDFYRSLGAKDVADLDWMILDL